MLGWPPCLVSRRSPTASRERRVQLPMKIEEIERRNRAEETPLTEKIIAFLEGEDPSNAYLVDEIYAGVRGKAGSNGVTRALLRAALTLPYLEALNDLVAEGRVDRKTLGGSDYFHLTPAPDSSDASG